MKITQTIETTLNRFGRYKAIEALKMNEAGDGANTVGFNLTYNKFDLTDAQLTRNGDNLINAGLYLRHVDTIGGFYSVVLYKVYKTKSAAKGQLTKYNNEMLSRKAEIKEALKSRSSFYLGENIEAQRSEVEVELIRIKREIALLNE